jgi:hypothetical protein
MLLADPIEYNGLYRLAATHDEGGYVVWAERLDRRHMSAGLGFAAAVGTAHYEVADHAFAAAMAAIDRGEWK